MKTSITPQEKMTDGQEAKVKELVGAALRTSGLQKDGVQQVIERGDELVNKLIPIFQNLAELPYADEEVKSNYGYPSVYNVKPIEKQVDFLARIFSLSLGNTIEFIEKTLPTLTLPNGAEGWFAIPKLEAVANRFFPEVKDLAEQYCKAVQLLFTKITVTRKFYNYHEGQLGPKYLRHQHARTAHALNLIAEKQTGDILIVPAQFGLRHRGRSVRRAREVFESKEFGLGAFATGIMILTHPERLHHYDDLWIDCAGDEYSPDADDDFSVAPIFRFSGGGIGFLARWVGLARSIYGSASGFLPQ